MPFLQNLVVWFCRVLGLRKSREKGWLGSETLRCCKAGDVLLLLSARAQPFGDPGALFMLHFCKAGNASAAGEIIF